MKGVMGYAHDDLAQAALEAFKAGCDILLIGGRCLVGSTMHESNLDDIRVVHSTLVSAVNNGTIKRERLDESVARILALKQKFASVESAQFNSADNRKLAFSVAQKADAVLSSSNATYGLTNTVRETFSKQLSAIMEMYHEEATQRYS
jgi:beta-glucosidase-like glycosyl hydrolase